ncbi:efflux RND transporter periplasmic adaptor subunit [Bradyrhizobium sp. dw_78]|uniref:efflux RND transporter periplasmic adaptor subunit n=1 Tax=Bradyrhizobium sp. dw_78 TaxID=2719793 RepID=UPI001BD4719A|nr:efflux RND transporter periplasmic adaptor subunit [Bradyrhizobium sp. dw_78]
MSSPYTLSLRGSWKLLVPVAAIALAGYLGWRHYYGNVTGTGAKDQSASEAAAPVPVSTAKTRTADFAVYLNGLGTAESYETVTVSSRVDGEITKVAFKQGQMVKQGDILVEIDPRPYQAVLDQALAKKVQDLASLKDAQLNLQRYATLAKQEYATRQQLDTQQSTVDQLTAQIDGDQALIDTAQTQVGYTTIRSPITGKTSFRLVDLGNIVHAASATGIVTIAKLQPISVVFTAPEQDIPRINIAFAAGAVPVIVRSSDGSKILSQGHLAIVNNLVDQASGTISMKATFENKDDALWPGLSVSTRLLVETRKQVTVVSDDAIQHGPNGLYAYVVNADAKVEMHPIKIGEDDAGTAVVLQGLQPGETVVTAGQYRLVQGSVVQSAPPGDATATPQAKAP